MNQVTDLCLRVCLACMATSAAAERDIDFRSIVLAGNIDTAGNAIDLSAPAERRLAYVIGNNDYAHVSDLNNAENDARLFAQYLATEGYSVSEHYGVTKAGFEEVLRKIARETDENTHVLIYFAGHGVQIGEANYLIPTDAKLTNAAEVSLQAISLNNIMEIAKSRSRTLVVFLDSCRDNPFEGRAFRNDLMGNDVVAETGFYAQQAPINTFLAFSTSPGLLAEDGTGDNSPFTQALVEVARDKRSETIERVMQAVRLRVYEETDQRQLPWESTSLVESFYLVDPDAPAPLLNLAQADTSATDAPSEPEQVVALSVDLDAPVDIGAAVTDALGVLPQGQFKLLNAPVQGRIETQQSVSDVVSVSYRPSIDNLPARDAGQLAGAPTVDDSFTLSVDDRVVQVQLTSTINGCDFHAGDHLDPDGVGIVRYPNEIEPAAALEACLAAVEAAPQVARFHYQLGRAYTALRDLENARAAFETARTLGHDRAYYALGSNVLGQLQEQSGRLSELAPPEVLAYFAAGAQRGDPYAMNGLGRQYLLYSDDLDRQEEGFLLLVRAAEMGHTFSMNALGQFFLDDDRPQADGARGLAYWQASADRNDIYGIANMGRAFQRGLGGLDEDPARAVELFKAASEGGHPSAPINLGILYATGNGTAQDPAAALAQFDIALERGNGRGGTNGALMFINGRIQGPVGSAASRAAKAATLSNVRTAERATEQLDEMTPQEIDAGSQALMVQLGADISVDGDFGPGSQRALDLLNVAYSAQVGGDGAARLLALATLFWQNNKFRVDLY